MARIGLRLGALALSAALPACYLSWSDGDAGDAAADEAADEGGDLSEAEADAGPYCPIPEEPNTDVAGTTPLGNVAYEVAVFGRMGGECGGFQIYLLEDADCLPSLRDGPGERSCDKLEVHPNTWSFETGSWVGTGPARLSLQRGAERLEAEGTITVVEVVDPFDPFDPLHPPRLTATLTLTGDGWAIDGRLDASWCAPLNVFCP